MRRNLADLDLEARAEVDTRDVFVFLREAIRRGIDLLSARQHADGSWPQEAMAGVFNETCMLNYDNYYNVFPTWALALFERDCRRLEQGGAPAPALV